MMIVLFAVIAGLGNAFQWGRYRKLNPAALFNAMTEVNKVKKLVRREPVASQVEGWAAQARKLPLVIQY